jgi:G3E family GTPase
MEEISAWIRGLNPFADIQPARFCRVNFDADLAGIPSGSSGKSTDPVALKKQEEFRDMENSNRPEIGTYVIKTTTPILQENLESFLEETAPKSYRIKGFVRLENDRMMAVQSCFGDVKTEIITDYSGPTELIGMGPEISHRTFGRVFRDYQKLPFRA